jgi:hypothetical protein
MALASVMLAARTLDCDEGRHEGRNGLARMRHARRCEDIRESWRSLWPFGARLVLTASTRVAPGARWLLTLLTRASALSHIFRRRRHENTTP